MEICKDGTLQELLSCKHDDDHQEEDDDDDHMQDDEVNPIKDRYDLTELFLKKIIRQMLFAIKSMHDLGIAHRDLKLDNIMLKDNNG